MNARFAETCRANHLELDGNESFVEAESIRDGRTDKELRLTCQQDLYIGVFFDGTNNNKYRDTAGFSHSNVARLYEAYPGTPAAQTAPVFPPRVNADGSTTPRPAFPDRPFKPKTMPDADFPYYRKIYVPGVGTPMNDVGDSGKGNQRTGGLVGALYGQVRLDWAMLQLCNQVHAAVFRAPLEEQVTMERLYHPGIAYSLAHATPLLMMPPLWEVERKLQELIDRTLGSYDRNNFNALLTDYERRLKTMLQQRNGKPTLRKIRLSVFGFSRGAAEARAWVNMVENRWGGALGLAGITLQIDFLGIFDTVASVGLAHSTPSMNGHFAWADGTSMVVPASVKRCVHLVAAFEVRGSFPLDSVCQGESLPLNCKEIVYPGVHSDVGGGYPPEDQGRACAPGAAGDCLKLSQVSLAQMYREARMAGVPLPTNAGMDKDKSQNFAIADPLRERFNAYIEATRDGTVEPTEGRGDLQFARMYPTETQPRDSIWRLIRRHHAYLLQWRKMLMNNGKGGIAGLNGLKTSTSDTRFQDAEDFRGAEQELRKELAFLDNPDPDKYAFVDDPLLDDLCKGVQIGSEMMMTPLFPMLLLSANKPNVVQEAIRKVMEQKQQEWDDWLRGDWMGDGALPADKLVPVQALFENHLHDSRAWFKPLWPTGTHWFGPNDEDWFTLGGREKKRKALLGEANKEAARAKASGDKAALVAAEKKVALLSQEGQPLIHGGREPYRLWGYLRHRQIYQSGKLLDKQYAARQQRIEREEDAREQAARYQRELAAENARHDKEVARIQAGAHRVLLDPAIAQAQKDEYMRGTRMQLDSESRFHAEQLQRIEDETKVAAQ